jgi:hypothetical protein
MKRPFDVPKYSIIDLQIVEVDNCTGRPRNKYTELDGEY